MIAQDATAAATALLNQLQLGPPTRIDSLAGGRNNRTFRVAGPQGEWLLKQYYRDPHGGRDRCASEWAWTTFCWQRGITWTPQPLACDANRQCALYEFILGRHLQRQEIAEGHVEQAAAFIEEVNRHRHDAAAGALSDAAEACFSWAAHLDCVDRRMHRLESIPVRDPLDAQMLRWLQGELRPRWNAISAELSRSVADDELSRPLPAGLRCLSPSDFGFHNALVTSSGRLRFVDFEYAGWDDPAKLICDFYWQQELPAPRSTQPQLVAALAEGVAGRALEARVVRLFPVHGVKWCCLLLNEFLAEHRQRREFARPAADAIDRRAEQLALAQQLLADVRAAGGLT